MAGDPCVGFSRRNICGQDWRWGVAMCARAAGGWPAGLPRSPGHRRRPSPSLPGLQHRPHQRDGLRKRTQPSQQPSRTGTVTPLERSTSARRAREPTRTVGVIQGEHPAKAAAGCSRCRLCTVYSPATGIDWSRTDHPILARSADGVVAGLASEPIQGSADRIRSGNGTRSWRAAGRSERTAGKVTRTGGWCWLLPGGRRDDGARPRGLGGLTRPGAGCPGPGHVPGAA